MNVRSQEPLYKLPFLSISLILDLGDLGFTTLPLSVEGLAAFDVRHLQSLGQLLFLLVEGFPCPIALPLVTGNHLSVFGKFSQDSCRAFAPHRVFLI